MQALVFLVALTESLAVVGMVVPGAAFMIAAGALVALGGLPFWPVLLLAVAGAIAGDGISFWLGHRYRDQLRQRWPFRRHPDWLTRGERFFARHGGKSILFGRFVGPVRPIVPVVAGMLGMRPLAFYTMNVASALVWAPAHVLPGMAFGASLALAGAVAARLAMLLLLLGALTWLLLWGIRWLFLILSPRAVPLAQAVLGWGQRHPRVNRLIGGLLDPTQPEFGTLLVMGGLLLGGSWLFLGVVEDVVTGDPLVRADLGLYQLLQSLRTPWGDRVMVFATELGDGVVIGAVAAGVLLWLLWRRHWRTAGYWVAAIGFGQVAAMLLKLVLQRPRPVAGLYQGISAYAFPSGHATMSMVVYGFLAVLVAHQLAAARRWLPYALTGLLISLIALSRLYLGAHWLSDVVGGLSLGLTWVCLLGIAYYRHPRPMAVSKGLSAVAVLGLVLASGWHLSHHYTADLQRYAPRLMAQRMKIASWWGTGWQTLPSRRRDLEGEDEQPLDVQWAGNLATIRARLLAHGWHAPIPLTATSALRWLQPQAGLVDLPILPQVHDGRHESLVLLGPTEQHRGQGPGPTDREQQLVLRLWNTGVLLEPGAVPLWVGNVSFVMVRHILLMRVPVTQHDYDTPRALLIPSLNGMQWRLAQSVHQGLGGEYHWDGRTLLIQAQTGWRQSEQGQHLYHE